jgi:hypothetical protein
MDEDLQFLRNDDVAVFFIMRDRIALGTIRAGRARRVYWTLVIGHWSGKVDATTRVIRPDGALPPSRPEWTVSDYAGEDAAGALHQVNENTEEVCAGERTIGLPVDW